ncbi:MAG: alpha/beta fold hydrolase [Chloroflexota bacterium]|nr:alpha/beta fold hydrolase [Chloroflexota bacterium]
MIAQNSSRLERRWAKIGPATIAYEVAGSGPPVVLVHGLSGSSRWWRRNIGALTPYRRVYVVDLIGFGASRARQRFVLAEAASYLTRWMDQLELERVSLVGHSMGGLIAAELAADTPDRVERLVLVDPAALPFDAHFMTHALSLLRELRTISPSFLPVLFADSLRAGPLTFWRAARGLMLADLRPKLALISAPTLVIWGEHDALVPLAFAQQLAHYLRYEELVVIKGAGHVPMWDRPQEFNRVLTKFLFADEGPKTNDE